MIRQIIYKFVTFFFVLIVMIILWVSVSIYAYSFKTNEVYCDAAVVLGAAIYYNKPSPVFKERINHAINLFNQGKIKYVIFTGGLGKDQQYTESEVARTYAIDRGVPSEFIYIDKISTTTFENLIQTMSILQRLNLSSILLISDPFHMKRSIKMAKDLGLNVNPSPTPTTMYKSWNKKLGFLVSEVYYYIRYSIGRYIK